MLELITIPMSHYCEKARWGLEYANLEYQERAHLQGFHYLAVRGKGSNGMVPLLQAGTSRIADSSEILKWIDPQLPESRRLYPDAHREQIEQLEEDFDEGLGIESRRWVYLHWKAVSPRQVLRIAGQGTPLWERALAPIVIPFVLRFIERKLAVTPEQVRSGRALIDNSFDRVAQRTRDGQTFLCGDRFTAADLSFACMAAPLVMPPEYGIELPQAEQIPPAARKDFERYREHPAGQYALRLFREFKPCRRP